MPFVNDELEEFEKQQAARYALGFELQAASRFIIEKSGYKILKAEEQEMDEHIEKFLRKKLGAYLTRNSDYIAVKESRKQLTIIDVKSKEYTIQPKDNPWFSTWITFTPKEIDAYNTSLVPVVVLVLLFDRELSCGIQEMTGPLYYKFMSFERLSIDNNQASIPEKPICYKRIPLYLLKRILIRSTSRASELLRKHGLAT